MIDEQDQSTLGNTSQRDMTEPCGANIWSPTDRVCGVFVGGQPTSEGRPEVSLDFLFRTTGRAAAFKTDWNGRRCTPATW